MENNLTIFESKEFGKIRTAMVDRQPVFCLSDVCKALDIVTPSNVKQRLRAKGIYSINTPTAGGLQRLTFIDETNLYKTIFQSRKQEAQKFVDWIAEEVLPSIRETGSYSLREPDSYMIDDPVKRAERWIEEQKVHQVELQIKEAQIAKLEPKAEYCDRVLDSKQLFPISVISKEFGMSAQQLNKILLDLHVQYKRGGLWYLYSEYDDQGFTGPKTYNIDMYGGDYEIQRTSIQMQWTQKGRKFIHDLLRDQLGILPVLQRHSKPLFDISELPDYVPHRKEN